MRIEPLFGLSARTPRPSPSSFGLSFSHIPSLASSMTLLLDLTHNLTLFPLFLSLPLSHVLFFIPLFLTRARDVFAVVSCTGA